MPLRETEIRKATSMAKPYKLADGEGLYLLVQPNGAKIWRQRYYVDGAEKLKSFGKYPLVTLAEAREKRFALRRALAAGEPLCQPAADRALRACARAPARLRRGACPA